MKKRVCVIALSVLVMTGSSLVAYAFFERGYDKAAANERLVMLINDSMCTSRR
ncbi:MAG: hypothetical protein AAGL99_13135 [Pseudomonadota bacterium]